VFACFTAYGIAYDRGTMAVIIPENLDLGGGQSFSLFFPTMVSTAIAMIGAILAIVGLLVSWRLNKQPLFSKPHAAALFFLAPLVVPLVFALIFRQF
jgi:phosphoglycerol transferase MdoB-like AlkP superfamily enzyme